MNSAAIIPFQFGSNQIRTITDDNGEPLFVAKDIAVALGYKDTSSAIKQHCKGSVRHRPLATDGGIQNVRVIHEPDLYRLIASSKLQAAQEFESLVFDEILPTIRKTGGYRAQQNTPLPAIATELKAAMTIARCIGLKGNQSILSANRVVRERTGTDCMQYFGVSHLVADVQVPEYTPTGLGKFMDGVVGQKVNKLLDEKGFQRSWRDATNRLCHEPTTKGEPFAVFKDTGKKHNGGVAVLQLFWRKSILGELGFGAE